jgi:hypothetical protein
VQAQPRSGASGPPSPAHVTSWGLRICVFTTCATRRLFERGYQIQEVAQFTLHDSWNELKRYANPKLENLRELTAPKGPVGPLRHSRARALEPSQLNLYAGQSARRDWAKLPPTEA